MNMQNFHPTPSDADLAQKRLGFLSIARICEDYRCEMVVPEGVVNDAGVCEQTITAIAPLSLAAKGTISFLANPKYRNEAQVSKASAILCSAADAEILRPSCEAILLVSSNPYACFARLSQFFFPPQHGYLGQSAQAFRDPSAKIASDVVLFPFVFVGPGAVLESRSVLYPGVFVGAGAHIGEDCILYPNSVVQAGCVLGSGCIVNPGAVIGGDGFGFAPDGSENVKIPQIGAVRIGRNVEVGANASIDRGTLSDTEIGNETKIDSLVQVAHNVKIGEACFLAAQSGVAGSSKLGNRVSLGGQVAVTGHVSLGDGVTLLGKSGVSKSLTEAGLYNGIPAMPNREYLKREAFVRRLMKTSTRSGERDTQGE